MKVVFGSVVYKGAEAYLSDFFASLEKQRDASFSVLILNDDIDSECLKKMTSQLSIAVECIECRGRTPIELRIELLKQAKLQQVDLLILGDCDDYFSDTRVYDTIDSYRNNQNQSFFYNELVSVNGKALMPELPQKVSCFREIGEFNFLGLSNTALNLNAISEQFIESLKEYQYNIFDWYLFSRILLLGESGVKVEGCNTIYRLHENNIAGIAENNAINIKKEIKVKKHHYGSLVSYDAFYKMKFHRYQTGQELEMVTIPEKRFWWNLTK